MTAAGARTVGVLASNALDAALRELAPRFERESGRRIAVTCLSTNQIHERSGAARRPIC